MVEYWRLTRNQYTRSIYDALKALGVTATRMYEYRAEVQSVARMQSPDLPAEIDIHTVSTAEVDAIAESIDFALPAEPWDGEHAVIASTMGEPVGRVLISDSSKPYVDTLDQPVALPGAYVRRVFVTPERRGENIASAMIQAGLALAKDEFNAETASALIAVDNKPSQGLFEGCGFERVGAHEYLKLGPLSTYRVSDE